MNYDQDKVDDFTLALLYLVTHNREKGCGARAWKSFDWDTLNRLHEKGFLSNPVGKAKSVAMTEKGFLKARELFEKCFMLPAAVVKKDVIPFPRLTAPAKKRWEQISELTRRKILENVSCSNCRTTCSMQLREGKIEGRCLVLSGICRQCGGKVARLIEPTEK